MMDIYWEEALKQDTSYWAWLAYYRDNFYGELRDKAKDAIARTEGPALKRAMASDNYNDCADFCLMYPNSSHYRKVLKRFNDLRKRDTIADTLNLIAGRFSHKDYAFIVINNINKNKVIAHIALIDKSSGNYITTAELAPGSDGAKIAIPTGNYTLAIEYTWRGFLWKKKKATDTIDINAKQYVYNVKIAMEEPDNLLADAVEATIKTICDHEKSMINSNNRAIRNQRAFERNAVENSIDSIMFKSHNRNMSIISCGPVDMTGANIGTTLILQNILLSYVPHDILKKDDRFVVYTIPANDDNTHAPIIVAAPCNPKSTHKVYYREQALRTLDFFLAADTVANARQHGDIHFVFYKEDQYLYQIGDLFKGKADRPQVALVFDEWVTDTINVESPESQGSVTFTPPVPQVKTDYGHTDLPHALYHICPAMVAALPESIYSALR